jgi:hypothetical protein
VDDFALRLRTRLAPALLVALGVGFLTAGLLSYTEPVEAGPPVSEAPTIVTAPPTAIPSPTPSPTGGPTPTPSPTFPADRVSTRVVIPALRIDLPVILPPDPKAYPLCDVAMYIPQLGQPGQGRATYIYAHAREGMFLPINRAAKAADKGASMLGMVVQVYTSDDMLFLYEIVEVRLHQTSMDDAVEATDDSLWLQTSEGPRGTVGKTQVVARLIASEPADPAEAHPVPKPRECA